MPEYRVYLEQIVIHEGEVIVNADDSDEAREMAIRGECQSIDWDVAGFEKPVVTLVEEVEA